MERSESGRSLGRVLSRQRRLPREPAGEPETLDGYIGCGSADQMYARFSFYNVPSSRRANKFGGPALELEAASAASDSSHSSYRPLQRQDSVGGSSTGSSTPTLLRSRSVSGSSSANSSGTWRTDLSASGGDSGSSASSGGPPLRSSASSSINNQALKDDADDTVVEALVYGMQAGLGAATRLQAAERLARLARGPFAVRQRIAETLGGLPALLALLRPGGPAASEEEEQLRLLALRVLGAIADVPHLCPEVAVEPGLLPALLGLVRPAAGAPAAAREQAAALLGRLCPALADSCGLAPSSSWPGLQPTPSQQVWRQPAGAAPAGRAWPPAVPAVPAAWRPHVHTARQLTGAAPRRSWMRRSSCATSGWWRRRHRAPRCAPAPGLPLPLLLLLLLWRRLLRQRHAERPAAARGTS
jgi:hypothetical protein